MFQKRFLIDSYLIFLAHQAVDGITVKPSEMVSLTTSKPNMKSSYKLNKTIHGGTQSASDSRIRRLIPYMSYYNNGHDYTYNPMEFLSLVNYKQQIDFTFLN